MVSRTVSWKRWIISWLRSSHSSMRPTPAMPGSWCMLSSEKWQSKRSKLAVVRLSLVCESNGQYHSIPPGLVLSPWDGMGHPYSPILTQYSAAMK